MGHAVRNGCLIAVTLLRNGGIPCVLGILPILGFHGVLGVILGSRLVAVAKFWLGNEVGSVSLAEDHLLERPL
jgi:hypothetical protein